MFHFLALTQAGCRRSIPRHSLRGIAILATAIAVTLVAQVIIAPPVNAESGKRPNIIFIMADDLGWKELGCYGQKKIQTPNVDLLARQGMRFTDYYTGAPVCAPTRCVLMTGMHLGHAQVRGNKEITDGKWDRFGGQWPLRAGTPTIATMLKQAGYVTGAFGKWGLGGVGTSGDPLKMGFDRFFGYNCQRHAHNYYPRYLVDDDRQRMLDGNDRGLTGEHYAPQVIADELLKFIRQNRDKPFFVYYPSVIPHLALQVPEKELAAYRGKWAETPYRGRSYLPHPEPRAAYAAMITFLDKQVGRILRLLDDLNLADNTIVFFTSDNGTTYLEGQVDFKFFDSVGPLRGLKGSAYEGGIREPMIVRWPGRIKPNSVSSLICGHVDAMATLADIASATPARETDGISCLPALLGRDDQQRKHEYLFWDFPEYGGQLAVRMGKWKGVKSNLKKNPDAKLQLYDLATDIGETHDVAAQYPDVVAKIEKIMLDARTPLRQGLNQLQRQHQSLAVVLDQGRPVGIVTVKDLIEPITGDLASW